MVSTKASAPLVDMTGISKRFAGVQALAGVSFELRAGEVHALMGENGAGKSTLMKVLAGIYSADAGEIRIDGKIQSIPNPRSAQQHGIGIIHQELSLMRDLNVAQNIFIGREPRRGLFLNEKKLHADAAAILASMNLALDTRHEVGALSIAKQQMVEIAKSLSLQSRILIMDEPTAALTDSEIEELFEIIRGMKQRGVGIIYISHKMDEIRTISDRVTVMRDGATVGTVMAAETPIDTIISMMVGRELQMESLVIPDSGRSPVALEVRGLTRGKQIQDVSFAVRRG